MIQNIFTRKVENRKKKITIERDAKLLTWPGGRMASNLSTPNIPKFDKVNVPETGDKLSLSTTVYYRIRSKASVSWKRTRIIFMRLKLLSSSFVY